MAKLDSEGRHRWSRIAARGDGSLRGDIPCNKKIVAHSDGDAVIHALCDALLGAMGRGDIGRLFPDNDPVNENRDSRDFLRTIASLMQEDGLSLGNADLTIIAQTPRIAPHIESMRQLLAKDMACESDRINIKATTTERLGFIGREEGIAVESVVILRSN